MSGGDRYDSNNHLIVGNTVTNAIFHFSKSAPILQLALDIFHSMYDPQGWATGGPDVLQRALLTLCGFDKSHNLRYSYLTPKYGQTINIIDLWPFLMVKRIK